MAVEYDLVIFGGTPEGYEAANYAAQLGARTAWILNNQDGRRSPLFLETLIAFHLSRAPIVDSAAWPREIAQATLTADHLTQDDFQQLMVQGIDVIAETGRLTSRQPLRFETTTRHLTTRSVLLATGNLPQIPNLPGLASIAYETPASLLQRPTLPDSVIVLGSAPLGLVLGQILRRYGITVTLVTPNERLLNREDPDVSQWIAAQLQAEGVSLRLGTEIAEIAAQDKEILVRLPDGDISASSLVLALPPVPNLEHWGVESVPIDEKQASLRVNAFLQTQSPRIYACGSVMGGHDLRAIAREEARLAVKNALFWNRDRIDYCTIPYALSTRPEIARVGLTEPQARQRYSDEELLVVRQPLYGNAKALWRGSASGFCKIMAHRQGQILGVHGVGPDASEWVQTMALLMTRKTPWWEVARTPTLPHTLTDILRDATQQWECDRWQPGQWRRDWAENWFNWRRSR